MITVNYFNRTNTVTIFNKFVGRGSAEKNIQLYADFNVAMTEAKTVKPITTESPLYRTAKKNFKTMCVRALRENEYIVGYCVAVADKDPAVICVIGNTEISEYFSMLIYHKRGNRYATQHRECAEVKQSKKEKFGNRDIFYIFNFYAPITVMRETQPAAPQAVKPEQVKESHSEQAQQPEPVENDCMTQELIERAEQLHKEERTESGINQNEKEAAIVDALHAKFDKSNTMITRTNEYIEHQAQIARLEERQRIIAAQPHVYNEEFKMKVVPPVYRLLKLKAFPKSRKIYTKCVDGVDYKYAVVKLTDEAAATLHSLNIDELKPEHKVLHMRPIVVTITATETHQDFILVPPYEKYSHSFSPCYDDMNEICDARQKQEEKENQLQEQTQEQLLQFAIAQKKRNDSRESLLHDGYEPDVNLSEVAEMVINEWDQPASNEPTLDHPMDVIDLIDDLRMNGDEDSASAIEDLTLDAMAVRQKAINKNNKYQIGA